MRSGEEELEEEQEEELAEEPGYLTAEAVALDHREQTPINQTPSPKTPARKFPHYLEIPIWLLALAAAIAAMVYASRFAKPW